MRGVPINVRWYFVPLLNTIPLVSPVEMACSSTRFHWTPQHDSTGLTGGKCMDTAHPKVRLTLSNATHRFIDVPETEDGDSA